MKELSDRTKISDFPIVDPKLISITQVSDYPIIDFDSTTIIEPELIDYLPNLEEIFEPEIFEEYQEILQYCVEGQY